MKKHAVMPITDYINICNTVREKTATTENIKAGDMPEMINEVYETGQKAGQKSEYDRFWDDFQSNGDRRNYPYGFAGSCWGDDTYNPKYEIIITSSANYTFSYNSRITSTKVPITINTATCTNFFAGCTRLVTIPSLTVTDKVIFTNFFNGCTALENITFTEESCIANNISFSVCPLTHDSLMSIINALKDYNGTTTTRTLTLHATSKALLTDTEKAIATQKGWSIA